MLAPFTRKALAAWCGQNNVWVGSRHTRDDVIKAIVNQTCGVRLGQEAIREMFRS